MTLESTLTGQYVVPVLRCPDVEDAVATATALRAGGLGAVELTMSTPDVFTAVRRLADAGATVGVGTITDPADVARAADAGATFVVSFRNPEGFVRAALDRGLLAIPGALTPSEVHAAYEDGARLVKLFPARLLEPAYLGDLAPLVPGAQYLMSGGIRLDAASLAKWHAAGARAVALGRELGTSGTVGSDEVTKRAKAACALVAEVTG